jgi:hypothetical protein
MKITEVMAKLSGLRDELEKGEGLPSRLELMSCLEAIAAFAACWEQQMFKLETELIIHPDEEFGKFVESAKEIPPDEMERMAAGVRALCSMAGLKYPDAEIGVIRTVDNIYSYAAKMYGMIDEN